jgi:hypothetical protein
MVKKTVSRKMRSTKRTNRIVSKRKPKRTIKKTNRLVSKRKPKRTIKKQIKRKKKTKKLMKGGLFWSDKDIVHHSDTTEDLSSFLRTIYTDAPSKYIKNDTVHVSKNPIGNQFSIVYTTEDPPKYYFCSPYDIYNRLEMQTKLISSEKKGYKFIRDRFIAFIKQTKKRFNTDLESRIRFNKYLQTTSEGMNNIIINEKSINQSLTELIFVDIYDYGIDNMHIDVFMDSLYNSTKLINDMASLYKDNKHYMNTQMKLVYPATGQKSKQLLLVKRSPPPLQYATSVPKYKGGYFFEFKGVNKFNTRYIIHINTPESGDEKVEYSFKVKEKLEAAYSIGELYKKFIYLQVTNHSDSPESKELLHNDIENTLSILNKDTETYKYLEDVKATLL